METTSPITSFSNPLVRRIKRLQQRARTRQKENAFFVEGALTTLKAIERQASIEMIVFSEALLTDEGRRAAAEQRERGVACVAVSEEVFRRISQRNNPDGLAAICRTTWRELDSIEVEPADVFVALVCISDPGNLGTILRTMDSVGSAGLILVGQGVNPFHPRTVRASRGAIFTVPMCQCPDIEEVFRWADANRVHTVATSARAPNSFWETEYRFPTLCIFGNENRGLDADAMRRAGQLVTIPMQGAVSSLNISVAVSLILYELKRIAPSET